MKLTLLEKEYLIDNVWAFRFEPSEPLQWTAGQYVRVELPHDNPDSEGMKRWFTNSAAPYEGIIQITTRITGSTFKQALSTLQPGDATLQLIELPDGDFVWEEPELSKVFIAGGIGITPFRSILKQRVHDGQSLDVTLIYGGRTPDLPFKDELSDWQQTHPELIIHYVIGKPLSVENIAELAPQLNGSLVYVSGPEPMVEALSEDLKTHGLADAQVKRDAFPNYNETNY